MPRYEKSPTEVGLIVDRMTERYHPQLRDAGVSIVCLMAYPTTDKNGDSTGPPIRFQGYPAAAVVKIIGLKERTDGRADAEICIDGDRWPTLSEAEKDALVDHEIEHLDLKTDKHGATVLDDLDRPKLKIRKHDHQHGWFDAIVRRHGRAALEFQQFEEFQTRYYTQRWLPYLDKPDTTPVKLPAQAAKEENAEAAEGSSDDCKVKITTASGSVETTVGGMKKAAKSMKRGGFAGKAKGRSTRKAAAHA